MVLRHVRDGHIVHPDKLLHSGLLIGAAAAVDARHVQARGWRSAIQDGLWTVSTRRGRDVSHSGLQVV